MSPQQDGDGNVRLRPRSNTTNFPSFFWPRDRQTAPSTPATAAPPSQPAVSLDTLLEALTPPNQPSLAHARSLSAMLPMHSPVPQPSTLGPILASLCSVNAPVSLQAAGYEVICAYHENDDASPLDTANRLAYFSLFLGPSINWSSELWEPRFRALRALTRDGTDILGIESAVLGVLEAWIQGAFDDLLASNPPASIECAERERTLEVVAPFLTEIVSRPAIVARLQEEEVMGVLQFYAGLFDQAISCSSPAPSLAVPDSPVLAASNPSRPTHSHRRHPSSLSVSSLSQHISTPVASARRPVDLAISAYLNHLNSQLKTMSPAGLDLILPVFFRALAFYATPLPRLSINANPIRTSRIESQLSETLNALLNGPYATTCMVILKRHLHPPVHRDDKIAKSIQVTIGAQRTLRNYIRRGLSARLARAYISRSSSVNYVPSGTPSLLHLERDLMERAWPKDDVPAWDGGKLGRILCKSVEAWVAFGNEPDALCHSSGRDAIFEEAAGTLKDILEELDSRDENSMIDEEEANAVGKTLYQLASSVRQIKTPDGSVLLMPLSQPNTAPSPFLRLLSFLLARDHKTYMNPPLSTILLSIAEHVTDIDTANVPAVMSQQHDLLPTSPDWLRNWEAIFNNPTLLGRSRPLTRHALMHTLQSVYDSVKDMPAYRKPLADLVHAFCEKRATDRAQRAEAMWQILGEEFVLRTVGLQEVSPDATSTEVRQPEAWVEKIISLLSTTALESEVEEDDTPSVAPADPQATPPSHIPTLNSSTSSSSSSRTQLDSQAASRESGSALPSVMSILTSLASGNPPRTQSLAPHVSDVQPSESPTSSPAPDVGPEVRSVSAVVALVTVFNQLAFTPHALSEANLHLAIRIFRIIVGVVVQGKSPKARLTALQFLMRLRTDCDHRLYFVDAKYDPDNHIFNLAKLVDRVSARAGEREQSEENIVESAGGRTARARHPHDGDASRPSQGRGARPSTSLSSRSRSRVPANPATRNGRGRGLMWQLPEQLHFPVHEVDTLSEGVLTYLPPDSPRLLLPISAYLTAIIGILEHEKDWDILSYVLCHLPVQLANRHTFCGPNCRALMVKLLTTLGMGIINGQLGSDIELSPPGLKPRDVQGLAYHTLSVLICYKHCFDLQRRHLLVEVFEKGLDGQPSTIKCCLHSLSLSAFELPASVTRYLSRVLEKLSQIMSNPNMAVHILAFLCIVASLPTLYSNFTENDFKMVFGVALKYLQHHNRVGASPSGSWALSQTVRFVSYYVVYAWFLAVKLPDRARHVSYITRQLLLANEGRDEIDESAEVCFDWLARYTYGSADPRPARSLLSDLVMSPVASGTFGEAALGEKSWIFGNSVVTIRTLARLGWIEVVSRRPSGLTKFLCRVENVPLVGPGDVDPDPVSVPAGLIMDYRPPTASAPASREADQKETPSYQALVHDFTTSKMSEDDVPPRPDPITGYVWSRTAPSQRRKYVAVDPSYFALQLSAYPHQHSSQSTPVPNQASMAAFLRNLDRMPVIDTHKVGILYVAPGQSKEAEILRNTHGSPAYTRFLEGIGRLVNLRGQVDVYAGGLNPDEDGEYAYAWWDDIGQVLYHTATMMPTNPDDPNSNNKKRHIGNDFVRIVWNDSGLPYRFDTLTTQYQFVNIVIEPHSLGAIVAFSNDLTRVENFKVTVQRAARMPEFAPVGDFKLISAAQLPLLVRQLSLIADWFASVFARTSGDTERVDMTTNWQSRLQAIKRFRRTVPVSESPEAAESWMAREMQRDFTRAF